ncbi:MAG: hypothetical protein JNL97_15750 [Verrucomicrobiales bacterium]|nr:hypothetical protein [Verrucomicrobiales bacterium]
MNPEHHERIQAWVDGELDAAEARDIAAFVRANSSAAALADNLRGFRDLIRNHPPEPAVDASRDFYWSRIRQGIERAETESADAEPARTRSSSTPAWLAWLIPGAAIATVALFALRPDPLHLPGAARASAPVLVEHVVESPLTEVNTLTFYSAADGMTVVWVGPADIL